MLISSLASNHKHVQTAGSRKTDPHERSEPQENPTSAPETCPLSARSGLDKDGPCALFPVSPGMVTTQAAASGRHACPRGAGQAGAEAAVWTPVFSVIKFFPGTLSPMCSS